MDKIWSLLNCLQIQQFLDLIYTQIPANVNAFVNWFSVITSIEILNVEEFIEETIYIPEREPYSLNLKQSGYETNLLVVNGQTFITNYMLHIFLSLLPFTAAYLWFS